MGIRLDCGHYLIGDDLVNRTQYLEDDDRLICTCSLPGCGYIQPARGSREVLAELHRQVLLNDLGQAGSLWAARKVLDREPVPYAGHIETGTRAPASTPYVKPVGFRPKTWAEHMVDAMESRAAEDVVAAVRAAEDTADGPGPWLLRFDLWWMRRCLSWQARDGVRLDIRVPVVTSP